MNNAAQIVQNHLPTMEAFKLDYNRKPRRSISYEWEICEGRDRADKEGMVTVSLYCQLRHAESARRWHVLRTGWSSWNT